MLKPNDIHEASFVKAVFGGYDMQSVDDFLDQVANDYQTIYNENLNLKQKLRLLVQKLEEYRAKEDALNQAQVQAAAIIADAERKAAQTILTAAPAAPAAEPAAETVEAAAPAVDKASYDAAVAEQEKRVENAKLVAENFISVMQSSISKHLDLLEEIKTALPAEKPARPYDYESEADPAPAAKTEQELVDEIAQNVSRFFGEEAADPDETKVMPKAKHFENLQFGKNYDPRA